MLVWWANGGITSDLWYQLQSCILAIVVILMIWWPKAKIYIRISSVVLFFLMIGFYVSELNVLANLTGSTWFGIILIDIALSMPKLIKDGYLS